MRFFNFWSAVTMSLLISLFFCINTVDAQRGIEVRAKLEKASGRTIGDYRALIIGINDYKDDRIPDLKTPVNDARELAKVLKKDYGFKEITLLLDREANSTRIEKSLRQLITRSKKDDSVLIYYAGHGDLDELTGSGWWIPHNATAQDPSTYIDNSIIQKYIKAIPARHVLIVADSCFSGTLFGEARELPKVIDDKWYATLYKKRSRWGMTSGNLTPVADSGSEGHSVFAYQFLEALKENQKPYLTPREIYQEIGPIIRNNSEQMPITKPIRNANDQGGEFIFIRTAALATGSSVTDVAPEPPSPLNLPTTPEPPRPLALQGHLQVNVNVSSAKVIVNGEEVGRTGQGSPLNLKNLPEGTVFIRVESEGYLPLERNAVIKRNEWTQEAFILKRKQKKMASLTQNMGKALGGTRSSDGRFIDHGDGTITDSNAGLMWTKKDSYADLGKCLDWNDSKSYVSRLNTGGYSDWRMPTVQELKAIFEKSKNNKDYSGDTIHSDPIFASGGAYVYWSSETVGSSRARNVYFGYGSVVDFKRDYCYLGGVRAVRFGR